MYKKICLNCVSREINDNELYCNDCKLRDKEILRKMIEKTIIEDRN